MSGEARANRRVLGFAVVGSAATIALVAALIYLEVITVAAEARGLMAGVLGFTAVIDMCVGVYFLVSDPS